MSLRETERADERQRNPALLILLIQRLPLKNSHPSPPLLPLTPPKTGKPLLNNIIVYLILTVTSTRGGKKAWLNRSSVLFLHWRYAAVVCGWLILIAPFLHVNVSALFLFIFFKVWGELLLSCFSSSYSKQKRERQRERERCILEIYLQYLK